MAQGIFGLDRVYKKQVQNVNNDNFDSWPENALYGYFAGGQTPSVVDTIDRLDFSNETTSAPGNNLSQIRRQMLQSVSNSSYGYFGYGLHNPSTGLNTVDRLDFSNETCSLPGKNLPGARRLLAAVQTDSYGYFGGGYTPAVNTVSRIDFSNETGSAPGNNLSQARYGLAGTSSDNYGYFAGGAPAKTTVDRIDFSNETVSQPGNELSQGRYYFGAVASNNYGYFGGGHSPYRTTVDRIDFANDATSAPGNNLPQGRFGLAGTSSRFYGYFCGGMVLPGIQTDKVERLEFSNETLSLPGNELTQARIYLSAVSGGASYRPKGSRTYGYFGGGLAPPLNPDYVTTVDRIDFSNETVSAPGNNLSQARSHLAAVSSNSYGYFAGGQNPGTVDTVDRIDFSNETTFAPGNNLTQGRTALAAVSSSSYGYFGGGSAPLFNPSYLATVDRIDFSNETGSAPGNNLSQGRNNLAAVSSNSYGYFAGGYSPSLSPSYLATVDRLDFSNETTFAPGSNLTQARGYLAAVSTSSYGYFGGGKNPPLNPDYAATVDRIDFSNETTSAPGNNLSQARSNLAAVSTSSYGYFGGGYSFPPPTFYATVDRIDFSNETTFAPGNNLPSVRGFLAGLSN